MRLRPRDLHVGPSNDRLEWVTPVFLNGWTNYGQGFRNGGWTIDELGYVVLRGLVANATVLSAQSVIFMLPNDARPAQQDIWIGIGFTTAEGPLRVDVRQDGSVVYDPIATSAVSYVSLSGIRFKPEKRII